MRILFAIIFMINVSGIIGQETIRTFIFGHSLINHEFQVNPTPSQETSVPHWFHFIAEEAGYDYAVGGQYGFLPQHANVPPIAQWGFDFVAGAWDSDNEPFSDADFTNIMITSGNFIQWQSPQENYPSENISPIEATNIVFDWCKAQEDSLTFYVYENWPDMAGYLGSGFPPNDAEWHAYNEYLKGEFHDWFVDYHDLLIDAHPNACVRMIPVGPVLSRLFNTAPFDEIPITELFEDDAPHGRPTTYFIAALTTYMAMTEEKAPIFYEVDPIIHPIIANNYEAAVEIIWDELRSFNRADGESRVFCNDLVSTFSVFDSEVMLYPNPAIDRLYLKGVNGKHIINIYNMMGEMVHEVDDYRDMESIDISHLSEGIYFVRGNGVVGSNSVMKSVFIKN